MSTARIISSLCITILLSAMVAAQQTVTTTGGTTNSVPLFTGSSSIGNSAITQSNGNIGIGTASPQDTLDVSGRIRSTASGDVGGTLSVANSSKTTAGTAGIWRIYNMTGGYGNSLQFWAYDNLGCVSGGLCASRLTLTDNGNVGIGTITPGEMLDVAGNGRFGSYNAPGAGNVNANSMEVGGDSPTATNGQATIFFHHHGVFANQLRYTSGTLYWESAGNGYGTTASPNFVVGGYARFGGYDRGVGSANSYSMEVGGASPTATNGQATIFFHHHGVLANQLRYTSGTLYWESAGNGYGTTSAPNFMVGGNLGIGTTAPGAKLEVNGSVKLTSGSGGQLSFADGTTQSTAWTGALCGGDYAESVDVSDDRTHYQPGDVLVIDDEHPGSFLKSSQPYSTAIAGVYSTRPGMVGRRQTTAKSPDEIPMAMIGIVPVKVSAENGPIRPHDLLVSSSIAGYAMKGTDRNRMLGAVIGKALGSLDSGKGVIEVLLNVQ